jgi:hypothetical protein
LCSAAGVRWGWQSTAILLWEFGIQLAGFLLLAQIVPKSSPGIADPSSVRHVEGIIVLASRSSTSGPAVGRGNSSNDFAGLQGVIYFVIPRLGFARYSEMLVICFLGRLFKLGSQAGFVLTVVSNLIFILRMSSDPPQAITAPFAAMQFTFGFMSTAATPTLH